MPLEPNTANKVDYPLASACRRDPAEACRVILRIAECEVGIIQNINERCLQFQSDPFANRKSLGKAHVKIEIFPAI